MSSVKTGKVIASIERKKKGVFVVFNDGSKLEMGLHSFTDQPLYEGKEISSQEFAQLKKAAQLDEYYDYALKLCSGSSKTTHEVSAKLESKKASQETISAICSRLIKIGLLDDEMYAKVYASDIADFKSYGRKRILYELKKKGIRDEILSKLVFDEENEKNKALKYAALLNKRNEKAPNAKKQTKMIQGLIQRGFDEDIAILATKECASVNDEESERNALLKDYFTYRARYEKKYEGYELRQRIFGALMRKGYQSQDIQNTMEENENAD